MIISHTKFPKNVVEKGMSKPPVFSSGLAVIGEIYSIKCLPDVAVFIRKHYAGGDMLFWPDLVLTHYAKRLLEGPEHH